MKFIWTALFVFMFSSTAQAISPINNDVIKEAQEYGQMDVHRQLDDFLLPWLSYEEKAEKLDKSAEHAYLYTPFLLIATDAREKNLNGKKVNLADSKRILDNYVGTISFSVVLLGKNENFGQNANVVLKQNKKVIKTYEAVIPPKGEKTIWRSGKTLFRLQCYFYFLEKNIACDKPMILSIVTNDKKQHNFYFSAADIK